MLQQSPRLRWYDHVRRSSVSIKDVLKLPLFKGRFRGRPAKSWLSCIETDIKSYGLKNADRLNKVEMHQPTAVYSSY